MTISTCTLAFLLTCGTLCAQTLIIDGELLNGNFNSPSGSGNVKFSQEPYWENIGGGNNSAVFLKDDEYFETTRNALIAETPTRIAGLDTGYTIKEGDLFSISYHWRDSFQWTDASDEINIRLFITDNDTISGNQTNLIESLSGVSTVDEAYEFVDQNNIYTANVSVAGKTLFIALDTHDGGGGADGFARIDNFSLSVDPLYQSGLTGSLISNDLLRLSWNVQTGSYYTVLQTTNLLTDWEPYESYLPATNVLHTFDIPTTNSSQSFFQVRKEPDFGLLVDPATPKTAQPNLVVPTGDTWVLDFSDEFNALDNTKWIKSVSTSSRTARPAQGIKDWWWRADHVAISNGTLALKISKHDYNTMYCGSVETRSLYETTYGYMEARIKCSPIEKGAHTAFWLQGYDMGNVNSNGADGCEVDIFESAYGNGGINPQDKECQTALHWDGYGPDKQNATQHWNAEDVYTGYHTFAAHWAPGFLDIYYDGVLQWHYDNYTDAKPGAVPQVAEWLWLSVGASFGDGNFQTETYPSYSYVDYVRVWKSK